MFADTRPRQLDLNLTPQAKRLIVLTQLVVLAVVGVKVVFPVPFAPGCDVTAQHQAQARALQHSLLVDDRQSARQAQHHRIRQAVGGRCEGVAAGGAHLAAGLQLDVNFQANGDVVVHNSCVLMQKAVSDLFEAEKGHRWWRLQTGVFFQVEITAYAPVRAPDSLKPHPTR